MAMVFGCVPLKDRHIIEIASNLYNGPDKYYSHFIDGDTEFKQGFEILKSST